MELKMRVRQVFAVMVPVLVAVGFTLLGVPGASPPPAPVAGQQATPASLSGPPVTPATRQPVVDAFGKVPLYFVENRGQLNGLVDYYVQGRDTSVYFGPSGVTFALSRREARAPETRPRRASWTPLGFGLQPEPPQEVQRWAVKLDFRGANPRVKPVGENRTPAVVSYFKGRAAQWKTALPTYSKIVYGELWPGIDLAYSGTVNRLKYDFVIQPGAGVEQIRLGYRGATGVRVNEAGQLEVSTPVGGFRDEKPYAYQEVDGRRVEVEAAYELEGGSHGFRVGPYDRKRPLIVDPAVLVYAGYIGSLGNEVGNGIAVDAAGNAYVTGYTDSTAATFPVTAGPDLTYNGGIDAFVAHVNAGGTALVYAGYIGGAGKDVGTGVAVDGTGNAYVTGYTNSAEATFPVAVGPDLTFNGNLDAFVAKVNAAGMDLVYAGYIGGAGDDLGQGIAVDGTGSAYVTGYATSTEATFPVTTGPDLTFNGLADAFVAKLNPAGTALVYAGCIGGANSDAGYAIAVDGAGNAYVTGYTNSSEATFPVTVGPDLTYNGGGLDAFVTQVNAAGTALVYAGYIGGASSEVGTGIAVDGRGHAYVTGFTYSTAATFPVTAGPDLTFNGIVDAFVVKVGGPPSAVSVTPSSGSGFSGNFAFRFSDQNGSGDLAWGQMLFNSTLSLSDGCYLNYTRSSNTVLLRNDAGTGWLGPVVLGSATVLENSRCQLTPAASSALAAGNNLTISLALLFKTAFAGTKNIYMQAKDNEGLSTGWQPRGTWTVPPGGNLAPSAVSVTPGSGSGSMRTFGFLYSDPDGYGDLAWTQMLINGSLSSANACYLNYNPGSNRVSLLNDASTVWLSSVVLGSATVLENSRCKVNAAVSSTVRLGTNLTVNLNITFKPGFTGLKNVYMQTKDKGGLGTGWQPRGTWTARGNLPPSVVSVTPSSGSGSMRTFAFLYSDPDGYGDLVWTQMLVKGSLSSVNACYLNYNPGSNRVSLLNDASTVWLSSVVLGSATASENSRCKVNAAVSSTVRLGTNLTVNLNITFKPGFTGLKNVYMRTKDYGDLGTGWQARGSWTAP